MTSVHAPRLHDTPILGEAALEADLLASLSDALDDIPTQDVIQERPRQTLMASLYRLGDAACIPAPEAVLTADLADVDDDVLTEVRLRLFEAGATRMRLAGALGCRLALRGLDAAD